MVNNAGGSSPKWGSVSGGSVTSEAATFATPSGSWGTVTHAALVDASTTGNLLAYVDVTDNTVAADDTVTLALTITQS